MRIIAGKNKKKLLKVGDGKGIRPTLARVKKSIFDILQGSYVDKDVLDLFAGAGSLGIEALCRGARSALFVDFSRHAVRIIMENLEKFGLKDRSIVKNIKLPEGIRLLKGSFSVVFMDAPYEEGLTEPTIKELGDSTILEIGAKVIIEVNKREDLESNYGKLSLLSVREYGDTKVYFYSFD